MLKKIAIMPFVLLIRFYQTAISPFTPTSCRFEPTCSTYFMDALKIEKAVFIGNSQGGTVSLSTALAHPSRIEKLVVADPAVYT